jgi:hypothetical protein
MKGGERPPIAANIVNISFQRQLSTETVNPLRKIVHGTKRLIEWIKQDGLAPEKQTRREFAVTEMYPRILYAFSDVIVFVLRNAK